MSNPTQYPAPRHSRHDIVRGIIALRRLGEETITSDAIVHHLGGTTRPASFIEGVLKVVLAAEGLVNRKVVEAISQVSVAKLRKEYPDLGGNSGSMQEVLDALREATVTLADREAPVRDGGEDGDGAEEEYSTAIQDRVGKELVAKIGAQNAMIVAESVRGVLAQEREAADRRLLEERTAADRRLQEERAAGDQRLAAAQAAASKMAEQARADAVELAEARTATTRSGGRLAAVVVGVLALVGGMVLGARYVGHAQAAPLPSAPTEVPVSRPSDPVLPQAELALEKAAGEEGGGKPPASASPAAHEAAPNQ